MLLITAVYVYCSLDCPSCLVYSIALVREFRQSEQQQSLYLWSSLLQIIYTATSKDEGGYVFASCLCMSVIL